MARKKEIEELKERLIARRNSLRSALDGDMDRLKAEAGEVGDFGDAARDSTSDDIAAGLVELGTGEILKIDTALDKCKIGKFGKCEDCERPIPMPRLQALPYAACCIGCQSARETE